MLTLNVTKTNYMTMTSQGKRYNNDECKIIIDESIIDCVSDTKFLGIMLDNKLSWKLHINHICNKVSKAIGILVKAIGGYLVLTPLLLSIILSSNHIFLLHNIVGKYIQDSP